MSSLRRLEPGFRDYDENPLKIPPYHYVHVLDQNTNVSRLEVGPKTLVCQDHERVLFPPEYMIKIPPGHFCKIVNPVVRDIDGEAVYDRNGQVNVTHADLQFRFAQDPFPLYPGEVLKQRVTPQTVVASDSALRLRANQNFKDSDGKSRTAGEEWLFEGPGAYVPKKEVDEVVFVQIKIIKSNQAIQLRAKKDCVDREGQDRFTGEEWLVKKTGAYLLQAYEEFVSIIDAHILTDQTALHLKALRTFKDDFGTPRKNGEEWLVASADTESHICGVYEEVIDIVKVTTLDSRSYCVILDPCDHANKPQLGSKKLVKGPATFFLKPGERLEHGIQKVYVLQENEGLVLRAKEPFKLDDSERNAGEKWMIRGPGEYVPPVEVEVITKRSAIPLEKNEGIYVKNLKTGETRDVYGQVYMLNEDEELWEKELPLEVELLLLEEAIDNADSSDDEEFTEKRNSRSLSTTRMFPYLDPYEIQPGLSKEEHRMVMKNMPEIFSSSLMREELYDCLESLDTPRNPTRMVTYRVPHNTAVQIYKYKDKQTRVVFGPELIMLGHDEHFTQLVLSAGKPKLTQQIRSLYLRLGPDFFSDIIMVETADHARLHLQLSYNWYFDIKDKKDPVEATKIFSVPDFVGDACKAMASRIRGAVATATFDAFHKNSVSLIQCSVFGFDENKKAKSIFCIPQNSLVITSIDIQNIEPADQKTRESLMKSVQMAVEITISSQEATARHLAECLEQKARGLIQHQKIRDAAQAENKRCELLELQAYNAAIKSCGKAKAEAESRAKAKNIEAEGEVTQARSKALAKTIIAQAELEKNAKVREAELNHVREKNKLEILKTRQLATIGTAKFEKMVNVLGAETIKEVAVSKPNTQVKMLQALGVTSTLITNGSQPVNLFDTAKGLIGC